VVAVWEAGHGWLVTCGPDAQVKAEIWKHTERAKIEQERAKQELSKQIERLKNAQAEEFSEHIERLKNAQAEELLKHMLVFQAEFAKGGHDE